MLTAVLFMPLPLFSFPIPLPVFLRLPRPGLLFAPGFSFFTPLKLCLDARCERGHGQRSCVNFALPCRWGGEIRSLAPRCALLGQDGQRRHRALGRGPKKEPAKPQLVPKDVRGMWNLTPF